MENWENKIIAEKMDSLEGLPDGYAPNLSAKWDIIQAGIGQTQKKGFDKRWLLGILFFAFVGIGLWLINSSQKGDHIALINNKPNPVISPEKIKEARKQTEIKEENLVPIKKKDGSVKVAKKDQPEKEETVEEMSTSLQPIVANPDTMHVQRIDTLKSAAPIVVNKKVSKRVYQRDFAGIVSIADTNQHKTAQKSFQIKLGVQNKNDAAPSQPALRLIQNF